MIVSARMSIKVTVSVADNDFVRDPIATYIQYVHKDKESNKAILIAIISYFITLARYVCTYIAMKNYS